MSIFIKGMEMPKHGDVLVVREYNGKTYIKHEGHIGFEATLSKIPTPHGRLIDADKIDYRNDAMHDGTGHLVVADNFMNGVLWINDCIDNAPTVIEAERGEE